MIKAFYAASFYMENLKKKKQTVGHKSTKGINRLKFSCYFCEYSSYWLTETSGQMFVFVTEHGRSLIFTRYQRINLYQTPLFCGEAGENPC